MKSKLILGAAVIIAAIILVPVFQQGDRADEQQPAPEGGALSEHLDAVDSDFIAYANQRLGLRMKIPKQITDSQGLDSVQIKDDRHSDFIDIGDDFFNPEIHNGIPAWRIYVGRVSSDAEFKAWSEKTYSYLCAQSLALFNPGGKTNPECKSRNLIPTTSYYDRAAGKAFLADTQGQFMLNITRAKFKIFDDAMLSSITLF